MSDSVLGDEASGTTDTMNDDEEPVENGNDSDDDDDEEDLQPDQLPEYLRDRRRAKSLPAYPEQAALFQQISQKRVKFADALGLNLASVKHFSTSEEPQVPAKVFKRLKSFPLQKDREFMDDLCVNLKSTLALECLVPTFKTPSASADLETRLARFGVALESVTVTQFDVRGIIRALGGSNGRREVGVRYTFNDWLSFVDAQAIPMFAEDKARGERFAFTMYTPPFWDPSASVHFAVYMRDGSSELWDNNEKQNYSLKYFSSSACDTAAFHAV